jgi:hypothetical protein
MTKHLEKIIGLSCIKSFCGYAGHLKISFSKEKNIVDLFINDQLNAEWEFETISGAWRLTQNDHLLTGSYEDYEHNDHELKKIISLELLDIIHKNKADIILLFENDYKIEIFNHGNSFPIFTIYSFNKDNSENCYSLNSNNEWVKHAQEEFTDFEKIVSDHAEKCANRWSANLPQDSIENHCKNCAYYFKNSGEFYFMDFGLCSNEKSVHDGKVVHVKTSCEHFDFEL